MCASTRAAAIASHRTASAFTAKARSGSRSHPSTLVMAAALTIACGAKVAHHLLDLVAIGDVEVGAADGEHVVPGKLLGDQRADLTCPSGDEDAHSLAYRLVVVLAPHAVSTTGARSRSGSHHARFAAYHPTVERMPGSNSTSGSHPSSRRIFVASTAYRRS